MALDNDSSKGLDVFTPKPKKVRREEVKIKKEGEVNIKKEDKNDTAVLVGINRMKMCMDQKQG
eukprot:217242-Ditylum_brightwellii.AAC.1